MDVNRAIMDAEAFAAPLRAVAGSGKDDMLPPQHVLVDIDSDDLVLSAIKAADDGDGIIVRFYNSGEKTLIGRILFGVSVREVIPVDLLEKPVEEPIKSDEDGIFSTEVPPKRIITWQVR
jgi:alpha-mannosidase